MKQIAENILGYYEQTVPGNWLTKFNWRKVKVGKMPFIVPGLCVAMYIAPLNLVLLEDYLTTKEQADIWTTDLIHEFYHAYQYHTLGPIKYLFKKVFNRSELEEEAESASLTWLDYNFQQHIR